MTASCGNLTQPCGCLGIAWLSAASACGKHMIIDLDVVCGYVAQREEDPRYGGAAESHLRAEHLMRLVKRYLGHTFPKCLASQFEGQCDSSSQSGCTCCTRLCRSVI
jgi:hypothetical protein